MVFSLLLVLMAAPPLPRECQQPPLREVAPLKELANLDGAFSAGLDAVATWCFDSAGTWNAGALGKPKKPISPNAPPQGDCLKAIASCEGTFETVKNKAPLRELAANALLDFGRPYRGAKYVPKRSGLKEVPSDAANCRSKSRNELFTMAQQRMDIARLSSTVLNEYANYKTWLFARGLECRNEVASVVKKDSTRTGLSIDQSAEPTPTLAPKDPETAAALKAPMVDKWKYFSKLQAKAEADRDYTLGFLASRELRACDCTRVNPAAVVRALEKKEGGSAGVSLLTAEDPANTRCAVCIFEVFPLWSARAQKQCASLDGLSEAELAKLEKSDDASGLPPRCLEDTRAKRAEQARAAAAAAEKAAADQRALAAAKAAEAQPQVRVPMSRDGGGTFVAVAGTGSPRSANSGAGIVGNTGAGNAGAGNTGAGNTGAGNTGAGNTGAGNTGAGNTGTGSTGTGNIGARNAGAGNTGTGSAGTGSAGTGNAVTGSAGTGNAGTGNAGTGNAGNTGTGNSGTGNSGTGTTAAGSNPNLQTVDGYTYYRPPPAGGNTGAANTGTNPNPAGATPSIGGTRPPAGANPAGTNPAGGTTPAGANPSIGTNSGAATASADPLLGGPGGTLTGPGVPTGPNGYVPPATWAPIPQREDGRIYVRLFMSSSCVADVEPGPLQARTGDLLLLPFEARAVQVKSPCGGLAEVYFGREARPRVSENFGSNRPLKFEFKRQ